MYAVNDVSLANVVNLLPDAPTEQPLTDTSYSVTCWACGDAGVSFKLPLDTFEIAVALYALGWRRLDGHAVCDVCAHNVQYIVRKPNM